MAFIVVYDANVLYPNTLRDLLYSPLCPCPCAGAGAAGRHQETPAVQYAAVSALVAQRIEHLTTDQKVGGSSPSERAR
jgi:hypothetical protein